MRAQLHSVKDRRVTENNGEINSDDNIPETRDVQLGLVGDQMFQRWLLDRVFHRKEMLFERTSPLQPIVGFLTGMDSTSYSISTSTFPPRSHMLPRHVVVGIEETGRSLHEMDQGIQVHIKRYTKRIRRACEEELIPARRMAPAQRNDRVPQSSV